MRRRVKRAVKTVIAVVIAVGAIASVPPSTWREADDVMRWHHRSIEAMARPAAERSADWFERQKHALRDRLGGIEIAAGTRRKSGRSSRFALPVVLARSRVPRE